jgi:hypothetical protein
MERYYSSLIVTLNDRFAPTAAIRQSNVMEYMTSRRIDRQTHNLKVIGSNPYPATNIS